uniref:Uncharacterized protein n=1 Tax=Aegilops tauschii subsp. strangulata TaxID=200361 RepID=A0A453LQK9_AEGTS
MVFQGGHIFAGYKQYCCMACKKNKNREQCARTSRCFYIHNFTLLVRDGWPGPHVLSFLLDASSSFFSSSSLLLTAVGVVGGGWSPPSSGSFFSSVSNSLAA